MKKILYTNCGPNAFMNSNGFKIFRCSASATPEERAAAEDYLKNYTDNLNDNSPVRFRYTKDAAIAGGRLFLMQQPSGMCYATNRRGNYFSQALIDCGSGRVVPINGFLQKGMSFPKPQPAEIDGSTRPEPLPDYAPLAAGKPDREILVRAMKDARYVSLINILIGAACECLAGGKQLVLSGTATAIPSVIQMLSLCLPKQFLQELTFNTFAERVESCGDKILGVVPGSVNLASYAENEKYIVIDLNDAAHPDKYYGKGIGLYVLGFLAKSGAAEIDALISLFEKALDAPDRKPALGDGAACARFLNGFTYLHLFLAYDYKPDDVRRLLPNLRAALDEFHSNFLIDDVVKKASSVLGERNEALEKEILGTGLFSESVKKAYPDKVSGVSEKIYLTAFATGGAAGVLRALRGRIEDMPAAYSVIFRRDAGLETFKTLGEEEIKFVWEDILSKNGGEGKNSNELIMPEPILNRTLEALIEHMKALSPDRAKGALRIDYSGIYHGLQIKTLAANESFARVVVMFFREFSLFFVPSEGVKRLQEIKDVAPELPYFGKLVEIVLQAIDRAGDNPKTGIASFNADTVRSLWDMLNDAHVLRPGLHVFMKYYAAHVQEPVIGSKNGAVVLNKGLVGMFYEFSQTCDDETKTVLLDSMRPYSVQAFSWKLENFKTIVEMNGMYLEKRAVQENEELIDECFKNVDEFIAKAQNSGNRRGVESALVAVQYIIEIYQPMDKRNYLATAIGAHNFPPEAKKRFFNQVLEPTIRSYKKKKSDALDFLYQAGGEDLVLTAAKYLTETSDPFDAVEALVTSECFKDVHKKKSDVFLVSVLLSSGNFDFALKSLEKKFGGIFGKKDVLAAYVPALLHCAMADPVKFGRSSVFEFFVGGEKLIDKKQPEYVWLQLLNALMSEDPGKELKKLLGDKKLGYVRDAAFRNLFFGRFEFVRNKVPEEIAQELNRVL